MSEKGTSTLKIEKRRRPVLWASALFVAINLLGFATQPCPKAPPEQLPVTPSWEWWRTKAFREEARCPEVLLLGSSLFMIPVALIDADFLNETIDAIHHHRSRYLESNLNDLSLPGTSCFNFSMPGAMMSDHFIVADALFKADRKPKVLVLGITLRDFIDNGVSCAAATPAYNYLKHYIDVDKYIELTAPGIVDRAEFWATRLAYLFGNRMDIQVFCKDRILAFLNGIHQNIAEKQRLEKKQEKSAMPIAFAANQSLEKHQSASIAELDAPTITKQQSPSITKQRSPSIATQQAPSIATQESASNDKQESAAVPDNASWLSDLTQGVFILIPHRIYPFQDNTREYKKRFRTANENLFANQTTFLTMLLDKATKMHIKVLFVNMPLTEANMKLMPAGSYDKYLNTVHDLSKKYGCELVDLNDGKSFTREDFKDPVHMNASGGKKLVDAIAKTMSNRPALSSALSESKIATPKDSQTY